MRETKFRGKTLKGEWIYGYLMNMHSDARLFIGTWKNIGGEATVKDELFFSYKEVDPKTVGQCIGCEDKNGKEIYESDRLRWIDNNGENREDYVSWSCLDCAWIVTEVWFLCQISEPEIIGNRYENLELLT